ncbi:MAG TPA: DUF2804 family protein [Pyrinomonadaceae bacterium]|nr:DUF2804 family protein [Pyrinomonadaceae bacterium]
MPGPNNLPRPMRWTGAANRPPGLLLPPAPMPMLKGFALLKTWRYVAVWTEEFSFYAGTARVGPIPQEFWAVWDRESNPRRMYEKTYLIPRVVKFPPRRMIVEDEGVRFDITLEEDEGFEVATPYGDAYTWTRKQLIPARGHVTFAGRTREINAKAFIDDNAGYHPRRTLWKWCGGIGRDTEGREVAWNAIVGLNDTPEASENCVWINGVPQFVGAVTFAEDLSSVTFAAGGTLRFTQEANRVQNDEFIVIHSYYEQPIGTFTGTLPGGITLAEAYGVMERQDALW